MLHRHVLHRRRRSSAATNIVNECPGVDNLCAVCVDYLDRLPFLEGQRHAAPSGDCVEYRHENLIAS